MSSTGRALLTLVGIVTSTGCFLADWNETHIYNQGWLPHAKFHNGQTMSMGALLGLCTLYYLYRSPCAPGKAKTEGKAALTPGYVEARASDVSTAALFASLYWITQMSGFFYPGAGATDVSTELDLLGSVQTYISGTCLVLAAVGWKLETDALRQRT